jgi:hypothetical protein
MDDARSILEARKTDFMMGDWVIAMVRSGWEAQGKVYFTSKRRMAAGVCR